jgi:paraquat-inducible protein A
MAEQSDKEMDALPNRMRTACHECDVLITIEDLVEGGRASCPRCGHVLAKNSADGLTRSLAWALSAVMLLIASNLFPFLSLKASGLEQVMTLPGSALELYEDGYWAVAVLVMGPIIGVPLLILTAVIAMLIPLRQGRSTSFLVPAARLIFFLNPWSMVEVFVIGVLVSLVKIGEMATVVIGISFWAYVAFSLCFIAMLTNLDAMSLWRRIEAVQS